MFSRPPSRPDMAMRKPSPSAPIPVARGECGTILEDHGRGWVGHSSHLAFIRSFAEAQALGAPFDHEGRNAFRPLTPRARHDDIEVSLVAGTGNELLLALST